MSTRSDAGTLGALNSFSALGALKRQLGALNSWRNPAAGGRARFPDCAVRGAAGHAAG